MKKQYLLKVQFADGVEGGIWYIGAKLDSLAQPGQRFYNTLSEAKSALNRLSQRFNKERVYNSDGTRRETVEIGGGFGADIIIDKKSDEANRIVNWSIQVREVSPWEVVENSLE